jgi:dTDP-L-rhamnose 4-epimerase
MRVLVTGAAGFVGSHVVDELLDRGHDVVALDSLVAHGGALPSWWRPEVEAHLGDVRDPTVWAAALAGVDAVCHQAARVGLGVDFSDVRTYVDDNDAGTAAGLWALHQARFRGRIVLASSMVVYGNGRYACLLHGPQLAPPRTSADLAGGRFDPACPRCRQPMAWALTTEDAPLDPRNVYAATKVHQEHLCRAFAIEHDVPVTFLRYHNVYGPRCPLDTPYAGVASIFRSAVAAGRPPVVFEDGGQTRDFVHVRDVAHANVLALTTAEPVDGPLNIASGTPRTVLDLARAACVSTDLEPDVVGGGRLGDVRHIVASPDRAAQRLGFAVSQPFDLAVSPGPPARPGGAVGP